MNNMRTKSLFIGFGVGVAVGAGGCYLYFSAVKKSEPRRGLREGHTARQYGLPETDIVREYDGFIAVYDYRTRNPKWILEHLTPASMNGTATREQSEFFPDPGVEPRFSAKLSDYRGSGYDRGHMAPAANHKASQKEMDETFSLVNISPQVGIGFNRDYWARFERFVKELTNLAGNVYVVTGPLWLPTPQSDTASSSPRAGSAGSVSSWTLTHDWIGKPPGLVAVPTHFYKVVVADPRPPPGGSSSSNNAANSSSGQSGPSGGSATAINKGAVAVGAFVMPNQAIDPRVPLSAYTVPLDALEQVAGTRFFPELLGDERRRAALDSAANGWRQEGLAQLKPFERVTMRQAYAALPAPSSSAVIELDAASTASDTSSTAPPPSSGPPSAASLPAPVTPTAPPSTSARPSPKTPEGAGVVHVCDLNACRLPSPDFYLRGRNASSGSSGGGGSSSRRAS